MPRLEDSLRARPVVDGEIKPPFVIHDAKRALALADAIALLRLVPQGHFTDDEIRAALIRLDER